jgi:hypothetical protein
MELKIKVIQKEEEETYSEFLERSKAHLDGPTLKLKIDCLYDGVFRKYFKHSEILSKEDLTKIGVEVAQFTKEQELDHVESSVAFADAIAMHVLEKIKTEVLEHFYEDN